MKPPPQIEQEGLRAYERMRAFEALRGRRMPAVYAAICFVEAAGGVFLLMVHHPLPGLLAFALTALLSIGAWKHWRELQARYERNRQRLAELEREYGEDLPWLQMERHMAALKELQRELEEERRQGGGRVTRIPPSS